MIFRLSELLLDYPCTVSVGVDADSDPTINSIEYDSRGVSNNTLFFCMTGATRDGHSYASAAYEAGCRAFIVEHTVELPRDDAVQVIVQNSRAALAVISRRFYDDPSKELTLIGVTGTKGKTTTSLLIKEILCNNGIKCGYIGTNGVQYLGRFYETVNSTPESRELQRHFRDMVSCGVTHVVMEVSSQALLPRTHRVDGLHFDTVVFTNLGRDHIGPTEHSSVEEYRDTKKRLFTDFGAKNIVWNADDPHGTYMVGDSDGRLISYAVQGEADYRGDGLVPYRDETSLGIDINVIHKGVRTNVRLRTPGTFSMYNGLAAIAVCSCYDISVARCAQTLRKISVNGRFEIVDAVPGVTFLIDYAHNGYSLTNALRELRAYSPKRLICLFGSVGGRTQERRRELAEASSKYADYSIITSDNPNFEEPESIIRDIVNALTPNALYVTVADRAEAIRFAVHIAREGDIVLLAGKGHETYQLINGEKVPFSERNVILDEASHMHESVPML